MKGRTIAAGLIVATVVGATGGTIMADKYHDKQEKTIVEKQTFEIDKAHRDAEKLIINSKLLKESLVEMNKMIVSKGTIETSYRFSNKDEYITYDYPGIYNPMKVLWNKLTFKDVTFTARYTYNITYDLSDITVKVENGCLVVILHEAQLNVEDFSIDFSTAYVDESSGILARDFDGNQIAAMIDYAKTHTENYVKTQQDFSENAIISLENNIKDICRKFGIERYFIDTRDNDTVANKDKFMVINNYAQQGVAFNK